ncbi:hypothetical protein B0H14DRAFT_3450178 [Mycena olivaceomarginata]|nr:hypothetical protein B0H14DRAFT_3450178 [Mycena olivaceomarginata]
MFKSLALFALLGAASAFTVRAPVGPAAAAVAHQASIGPIPDAITVLQTCVNVNLNNCLIWTASDVSSVTSGLGIACTLFTSTTCTGASQIINGTLNDLNVVGYNDKANSFTCASN